MDSAPIRRWNPGFIARRWRHQFWILPLIGLAAGLLVDFLPVIRGTATGVVQMRSGGSNVPSVFAISPPELNQVIRSDEILRATIRSQDLAVKWRMSEQACITDLRAGIRCRILPGTTLAEIQVNGKSRAESFGIWNSLIQHANDHFSRIVGTMESETLATHDFHVATLTAESEDKRRILSNRIGTSDLLHRFGPNDHPSDREFLKAKSDFEKAQAELDAARIARLSAKIQSEILKSPLAIHQAPDIAPPLTLSSLVVLSCVGLGSGMVLAVAFAYLLELMVPRKTPAT